MTVKLTWLDLIPSIYLTEEFPFPNDLNLTQGGRLRLFVPCWAIVILAWWQFSIVIRPSSQKHPRSSEWCLHLDRTSRGCAWALQIHCSLCSLFGLTQITPNPLGCMCMKIMPGVLIQSHCEKLEACRMLLLVSWPSRASTPSQYIRSLKQSLVLLT